MQQNLLQECEHQLNQEIEKNVVILNHLSQWEQAGEKMPHREKQNSSKLCALKFNEELHSGAEKQHWQFGAQSISTDSESEVSELEMVRHKTREALVEIANRSQ